MPAEAGKRQEGMIMSTNAIFRVSRGVAWTAIVTLAMGVTFALFASRRTSVAPASKVAAPKFEVDPS